jgi:hypothetical protein
VACITYVVSAACLCALVVFVCCAAYLDDSVGYPIAVDELVPVQGGAEVIWWFQVRHADPTLYTAAAHLQAG